MLDLTNITLVTISSVLISKTEMALDKCLRLAKFHDVIFFSHKPTNYPTVIIPEIRNGTTEYSTWLLRNLTDYVSTPYALIVQHDGYILRPDEWSNTFLRFDYIGAPWNADMPGNHYNIQICGNGGFSLRSKKLLDLSKEIAVEHGGQVELEDQFICLEMREEFIKRGIRIAPAEIGWRFSREWDYYEGMRSFGFHKRLPKAKVTYL